MLGSTFIYEKDIEKLKHVDIESLHEMITLELDKMMSIDFQTILLNDAIRWVEGQPIVNKPESGIVIAKVKEGGLKYVLSQQGKVDPELSKDLKKLSDFVGIHGLEDIYELSIF